MLLYLTVFGLISGVAFSSTNLESGSDHYFLTIKMPNVVVSEADELLCTAMRLDPTESYIVRFIPHGNDDTAHHMTLLGCPRPASSSSTWLCNELESLIDPTSPNAACLDAHRKTMFLWGRNAPEKVLPDGVGIRISGNTDINYLVLQIHYVKPFPPGVTDNSGFTLELTRTRPAQQVGYVETANLGVIPPHRPEFFVDLYCKVPIDDIIYPIAYAIHSHNLGVLISGYRIREGQWMEIGRNAPLLQEAFYDVSNPGMDIRPGDVVAVRCVMNSMSRDTDTMFGPTDYDEMCNFDIMYSTYKQGNIKNIHCYSGTSLESQRDDFPPNAVSLDGIPRAEEIKEKFNVQ